MYKHTRTHGSNADKSTVWNVLHIDHLHPFKKQKMQDLEPGGFLLWMGCAWWFLKKVINSPNFFTTVLFSDKALMFLLTL